MEAANDNQPGELLMGAGARQTPRLERQANLSPRL